MNIPAEKWITYIYLRTSFVYRSGVHTNMLTSNGACWDENGRSSTLTAKVSERTFLCKSCSTILANRRKAMWSFVLTIRWGFSRQIGGILLSPRLATSSGLCWWKTQVAIASAQALPYSWQQWSRYVRIASRACGPICPSWLLSQRTWFTGDRAGVVSVKSGWSFFWIMAASEVGSELQLEVFTPSAVTTTLEDSSSNVAQEGVLSGCGRQTLPNLRLPPPAQCATKASGLSNRLRAFAEKHHFLESLVLNFIPELTICIPNLGSAKAACIQSGARSAIIAHAVVSRANLQWRMKEGTV